jgi:hypothetical protein
MPSRISVLFTILILALTAPQFAVAATSVDLMKMRKVGETHLRNLVGDAFTVEGIYFRDGAANTDSQVITDLAAIFMVAKLKGNDLGSLKLAYVANLDGHSDVLLANIQIRADGKLDVGFAQPLSGHAIFPSTMPAADVQTIVDSLKTSFPSVKFNFLSFIGILTFDASTTAESFHLMAEFAKRGLQANYNGFAYPLPVLLDLSIYLGDGTKSKIVETTELRTVSAQLLKSGKQFQTPPTLPSELNNL